MKKTYPFYFDGRLPEGRAKELAVAIEPYHPRKDLKIDDSVRRLLSGNPFTYIKIN
jgi:hypothetical protein